jgi:predicted kinase
MTLGLPASGKSTWAKEQVAKSGGQMKRVNKDDMRNMIDGGKYSRGNEKSILAIRDLIIEHYLSVGISVVVDDTNLHPKHKEALKVIAAKYDWHDWHQPYI